MKYKDRTGLKFGMLTAIEYTRSSPYRGGSHAMWMCRCDCGNYIEVYGTSLSSGRTKSCGCNQRMHREQNKRWNGYKDITGTFWNRTLQGARVRNFEFLISKEYMWDLLVSQNFKCILSNTPIVLSSILKEQTASIDRIDSSLGYIEGNVQWVHKDINRIKQNYKQDYFIELCKLVALNNS